MFKLSKEQMEELTGITVTARANALLGGSAAIGAYAPVYKYLLRVINPELAVAVDNLALDPENSAPSLGVLLAITDSSVRDTAIWLVGGIQVNSGTGAFSSVIREYNRYQGFLRYGQPFSDELLQKASNAVGELVYQQVLESKTLPTVEQIGEQDLIGVRDVLYIQNDDNHKDLRLNQAWPGIIMLNKLGETGFVDRLLQQDEGDAVELNTTVDLQALLFTWASFEYAYKQTKITNSTLNDAGVALNIMGAGDFIDAFSAVSLFKNLLGPATSPAKGFLFQIADMGTVKFLNMLESAVAGHIVEDVTSATLAKRAQAFFSVNHDMSVSWMQGGPGDWQEIASRSDDQGLAYRNALNTLSLVAVSANNIGSGKVQLSLYDEDSGAGEISRSWIEDRSKMLQAATRPSSGFSLSASNTYTDISANLTYQVIGASEPNKIIFGTLAGDGISGSDYGDHLYGGAGSDSISGGSGTDYIEGGADNDSLEGGAGSDTLLGMSGNDTLLGGQGGDLLIGGKGSDTYKFVDGDGADTIMDSDGNGAIMIGGTEYSSAKQVQAGVNIWKSSDDLVTFAFAPGTSSDVGQLTISYGYNNVITVVDYELGSLGLHFTNYEPAELPPASGPDVVQGDLQPADTENPATDEYFNLITSGVVDEGREDYLWDHEGDTLMLGLAGNDHLLSDHGGNDTLDGGDGNDVLQVYISSEDDLEYGKNLLIGGDGADIVYAGQNDDVLFGGFQVSLADAAAGGGKTNDSKAGDFLAGFDGDDTVIGAGGDDILLGGDGDDYILGGAGNDYLNGDTSGSTDYNFGFIRDVRVDGDQTLYTPTLTVGFFVTADKGGDDTLIGGAGDDWIWGAQGDDQLEGGTGNDVIFGGDDNDTVLGGDGNDTLVGDSGLQGFGDDLIQGGDGDDSISGQAGEDFLYGENGNDVISGDASNATNGGNDYLNGGDGRDTLYGNGGNDTLFGGDDDDIIFGDDIDSTRGNYGSDQLHGGGGTDTLVGGLGNDTITGDDGDDVIYGDDTNFITNIDGNDWLDGGRGNDSIFGAAGSDTLLGGEGHDLLVGDDIYGSYSAPGANYLDGGLGNDTLIGDSGSDTLIGGGGNDYISGNLGQNLFYGGAGNDTLSGGSDTDTYVFNLGDGRDKYVDAGGSNTIRFGAGISADTISVKAATDGARYALIISDPSGDSITLYNVDNWGQSTFVFDDGTVLSFPQLLSQTTPGYETVSGLAPDLQLYGSAQSDVLSGMSGNDVIRGFAGNDILAGEAGDDQYVLIAGDGDDVIDDLAGKNSILFAGAIKFTDLIFSLKFAEQGVSYLVASYSGGSVSIKNGTLGTIDSFQFSDGTTVSYSEAIKALPGVISQAGYTGGSLFGSDGADTLFGGVGTDAIFGAAGADNIRGGDGGDTLYGGLGDDTLKGDAGNDTLIGGGGDDLLSGGYGDDVMQGGAGYDSYQFGLTTGNDIISAETGINRISVDAAYGLSDLTFNRERQDLILAARDGSNTLKIIGYFDLGADWIVSLAGANLPVSSLMTSSGANIPLDLDSIEHQFKQAVANGFGQDMIAQNLDVSQDGASHQLSFSLSNTSFDYSDYKQSFAFAEINAESSYLYVNSMQQWNSNSETTYQTMDADAPDPLPPSNTLLFGSKLYDFSQPGVLDEFIELLKKMPPRDNSHGSMGNDAMTQYAPNAWIFNFVAWINQTTWPSPTPPQPTVRRITHSETSNVATYSVMHAIDVDTVAQVWNRNIFYGGDGNDLITAQDLDPSNNTQHVGSMLSGGAGNDRIFGSIGDDVLVGGSGDNLLLGGRGKDTYYVSLQAGSDIIKDSPDLIQYLDYTNWPSSTVVQYLAENAGDHADKVVLPDGVALSDLSVEWGSILTEGDYLGDYEHSSLLNYYPKASMLFTSLDITLPGGHLIRVVVPHTAEGESAGIESIQFGNGVSLSIDEFVSHFNLGAAPDLYNNGAVIAASAGVSSLAGGAGNDTILGGDDPSNGGDNPKSLYGGEGDDSIVGGLSFDYLYGGKGSDTLDGGDGEDQMGNRFDDYYGGANTYIGGLGNDTIYGTEASDTIYFNKGDGYDTVTDLVHDDISSYSSAIYEAQYGGPVWTHWAGMPDDLSQALKGAWANSLGSLPLTGITPGAGDTLVLGAGINPSDVTFEFEGSDLIIGFGSEEDQIRFSNWSKYNAKPVDRIVFDNGEVWDSTKLKQMVPENTSAPELSNAITFSTSPTSNVLNGTSSNDVLLGQFGNDELRGGLGDDILSGGVGNDSLYGGDGADTYLYTTGGGRDTITTGDSGGAVDTLKLTESVNHNYLWLSRSGDDLKIYTPSGAPGLPTSDVVTVAGWYNADGNKLSRITTGDGASLLLGQVQSLVDAMAAFSQTSQEGSNFPTPQREQLDLVIAASWQ